MFEAGRIRAEFDEFRSLLKNFCRGRGGGGGRRREGSFAGDEEEEEEGSASD